MLVNRTVAMRWGANNKKIYEEKGYIFTKWMDSFSVKVEDLSNCSSVLVDVECDYCGKIVKGVTWVNYKIYTEKDGNYHCQRCSFKGQREWISFEQWCYGNLPKVKANELLSRWDYEKNGNLNPKNISFRSNGFDGNGYWFKCLTHLEHISEQKSIDSFVRRKEKGINCNQCNSLSVTHPELAILLIDEKDAVRYSAGSHAIISAKCPTCGFEKEIRIKDMVNYGFGCPRCSDGVSYPEKFLSNMLGQLGVDYKTQLSKTAFDWCGDYRYDYYLSNVNCIIETHGRQHYEDVGGNWGKINETQENDRCKESIARKNGIENYIILDCRKSSLEWIRESVLSSPLLEILNFHKEIIDWKKCHRYACSGLVYTACDYWNRGMKDRDEISNYLGLSKGTIWRYLRQGFSLGWCDYEPRKFKNKIV